MSSVRFPVQAGRAPDGATISLADKSIPIVEVLQARRWARDRRRCGCLTRISVCREYSVLRALPVSVLPGTSIRASAVFFPVALIVLSLRFRYAPLQSAPLSTAGNISRIDGNGIEEPEVGEEQEGEEDGV